MQQHIQPNRAVRLFFYDKLGRSIPGEPRFSEEVAEDIAGAIGMGEASSGLLEKDDFDCEWFLDLELPGGRLTSASRAPWSVWG
jgi:hypothetical protein